MSTLLIIILSVVAVVAVSVAVIAFLAKKKPEVLEPVMKLMFRSRKVREKTAEWSADKIAENPDMIEQIAESSLGREQSRALKKHLSNKTEAERKEFLETTMVKAAAGETVTVADVQGKPKVTKAKVKHRRAKNKAARKQRKRQRR